MMITPTRTLPLLAMLLLTGAASYAQRTITLGSCGGTWSQGPWVGKCTWSGGTFLDSLTFYANATCSSPCTRQQLQRSATIAVGQTNGQPCPAPVTFNFQGQVIGASQSNPVPYLYIYMTAQSALVFAQAWTGIDCNNVPFNDGYPIGSLPC
jgi:hypothetical protein